MKSSRLQLGDRTGWFNCWHPNARKRIYGIKKCREPFFCVITERLIVILPLIQGVHQHHLTLCDYVGRHCWKFFSF